MRPTECTIRLGPALAPLPTAVYAGQKGRPADPTYPPYWQSDWTMYRVFGNYADALPPYHGTRPA